jgi:cyclophilin family peptidyl-prolyl cis-trans isomerase
MMIKKIIPLAIVIITLMSFNTLPPKGEKETKILISTEYGDIKIKLYNETPKHRDNFIKLVKEGFYNETLFHRVIASFMIQGGDPDSKGAAAGKALGEGGTGYTIPAEIKSTLIHKKGALSAARMGDNVNPMRESSGCQFYIVQGKKATKKELDQMSARSGSSYTEEQVKIYETIGGTPFLDMNYTVFGEVIEGLDVVDKIAAVEKDRRDRPKKDVKMTMKIVKK